MEPMTNYEILFAFYETGHLINGSLAVQMTVLAGFMVASVMFGQVLDRIMTTLFVGLYSFFYLMNGAILMRQLEAYTSLMHEIRERNAQGVDFSWHGGVDVPEAFVAIGVAPFYLVLIVAFVGSLIFFFRTRKLDPRDFH